MRLLLYPAVLWLLLATPVFSQTNPNGVPVRETIFYTKTGNPDWLAMRPGVQVSAADLVRLHKTDLGLTERDELLLYRTDTDALGFAHHRYQQYYQGVPVDGGELLVHEKDGFVRTLNGKLVRGLQTNVRPALPAADALQRALQHISAQRYMWESPRAEALLRRITNNPKATFYPQPELVLVAPGFTQKPADFQIAWRLIVHSMQPEEARKEVFVSALDGSVLEAIDLTCNQNTPGTAETYYSGTRDIITQQLPDNTYRLVETTRGNGIETYNMQSGTDFDAAVDFIDDDNHWDNTNIFRDEVATDAHWGAEMTYDYFLNFHEHSGLDGNDMALINFVHYGSNYQNAFWNGSWASFGDAASRPFVSLDVVGHEFTHGVTNFSANLRYRNESGALNEAFSDIFGAAIEFWARPEKANWLIGEELGSAPFRNMANPKAENHPNTYKGQNWVTGTGDNGGVHSNSSVKNHWFYLLTEGGSGTNDNGDAYVVTGQGIEMAAEIAFRSLKYYLVVLSNYADAREGALQAAEDLYGTCSVPFVETANAWYAVGVGQPFRANDLNTTRILEPGAVVCGLTGAEPLTVQLRYAGCNADLLAGDKIPVAYQIDALPVVWDTLVLAAPLAFDEVVNFTFSVPPAEWQSPVLPHSGWAKYEADPYAGNDAVDVFLESIIGQNTDVRLLETEKPVSGCFLGTEKPQIEVGFRGCDSLPAGTEITLFYSLNGEVPVSEVVQTPFVLYTGDSFKHTFSEPADLSATGRYNLDVWAKYGPDEIPANDSLNSLLVVHPAPMTRSDMLTFETPFDIPLDSVFIATGPETEVKISSDAARTGAAGLRITGGDLDAAFANGTAQVPTLNNVWNTNPNFRAQVCLCADLTGLASAELQFDLKQTFSFYYLRTFGAHAQYGSAMRVLANNEPLSQTYRPTTPSFDQWKSRKEDLGEYLGGTVKLCFETHTGISPELDTFANSFGDRVLLDNITIVGQLLTGTDAPAHVEPDWSVLPNPGSGMFTVSVRTDRTQPVSLTVTDALGRTIRTQNAVAGSGKTMLPLNLEGAAPGVYLVQLGLEQERYVRKVVVRN
ncbi:MAG: M4 family metallopeptidase [Lewinellaceae bacterium]|nr:M4 family metallopeptidase [Lewinellaceae bacterium]